jgi:hypothetical protein
MLDTKCLIVQWKDRTLEGFPVGEGWDAVTIQWLKGDRVAKWTVPLLG